VAALLIVASFDGVGVLYACACYAG
jgi:hypothetical protein